MLIGDLCAIALYAVFVSDVFKHPLLNLDGEQNVGAWWSGAKLLMIGQCFLIVPLVDARKCITTPLLYWAVGLGFFFLSLDEVVSVHERITAYVIKNDLSWPLFNDTNGAWIFLYGLICLVLLITFAGAIKQAAASDAVSVLMLAGGFLILLSGAVGVEVLSYYDLLFEGGSAIQIFAEEGLELLGVTVMVLAAYRHASRILNGIITQRV